MTSRPARQADTAGMGRLARAAGTPTTEHGAASGGVLRLVEISGNFGDN